MAPTSARVDVNGVELYYEIHGQGEPLILLHGGANPSEMFGEPLARMRKTGEMNQPAHDWSAGVAAIASPVLIIFGDADSIELDHMMQFYQLLGGGQRAGGMDGSGRSVNQLAIIPNRTHYDILTSPAVTTFATEFLQAE